MKKVLLVLLLISSSFVFAWVAVNDFEALLIHGDWLDLEEDNLRPVITITGTNEEYYNEWDCYDSRELEVVSVEVTYRGEENYRSPTVYAYKNGKLIEFSLDPVPLANSKKVIKTWKNLIHDSISTCMKSAFLQNTSESELRIVDRIKTQNGVWDFYKDYEK